MKKKKEEGYGIIKKANFKSVRVKFISLRKKKRNPQNMLYFSIINSLCWTISILKYQG